MNPYLTHLQKIEFVVTNACTGQCKHCSQGAHTAKSVSIDPQVAADAVRKLTQLYKIQTVMTFGGEPLLSSDAVCAIHAAAKERGVPRRQLITNGYFSQNEAQMAAMAERLAAAGVNDLLLSVDAFHQETIPVETVLCFAGALLQAGVPVRTQPAWLVSVEDDNPYNRKTKALLALFEQLGISANEGNLIFPEGNAKRYLADYFTDSAPENPYVEDPCDLYCLSVSPDGDCDGIDGNLYQDDLLLLLEQYRPQEEQAKEASV